MSSRPPVHQHSNSVTYMATVPQPGESLYQWATTDYFEMNKKMWLNANVSTEHTLKVMPCFKNYRIYAKVAERECDRCYQINQTRPPGAPKIPCIVSDLEQHDKRCALCIVTKRKKKDCEGDGFASHYPSYYEHQPRRYEPDLARSKSRNVRERSLHIDNERDLEARKRARLSLGPERIRSTNVVENRSRATTQKLPSQEPESVRSMKVPEKQSNQPISRSEVKELLAESERLAKESFHEKRTEVSAPPTTQVNGARSTRCGSEVDELLLETICTSPVPIKKGKSTDSECTMLTIRSTSSRRESASSTTNTTTTSVFPPTLSENFNELLQPLIAHMTRKDQLIVELKSQLEEEKSSSKYSQDLIKKAAETERKFARLQEEYRMMKELNDRASEEVHYLRKDRNRLSKENETLKGKNISFQKAFREFSDLMENGEAGK